MSRHAKDHFQTNDESTRHESPLRHVTSYFEKEVQCFHSKSANYLVHSWTCDLTHQRKKGHSRSDILCSCRSNFLPHSTRLEFLTTTCSFHFLFPRRETVILKDIRLSVSLRSVS